MLRKCHVAHLTCCFSHLREREPPCGWEPPGANEAGVGGPAPRYVRRALWSQRWCPRTASMPLPALPSPSSSLTAPSAVASLAGERRAGLASCLLLEPVLGSRARWVQPSSDCSPLKGSEQEAVGSAGENGSFYINRGPPGVRKARPPSSLRWCFRICGDKGRALNSLLARSFPTAPGNKDSGLWHYGFCLAC